MTEFEQNITFADGLGVMTDLNFCGNPTEVLDPAVKSMGENKHQTAKQIKGGNWEGPYSE